LARPETAACSRNTSAGPAHAKTSGQPMRRPTSVNIHQSGLAPPGAARNGLLRLMRRSELVTVPLFSPHEELPGDVEGHAVRPVHRDGFLEAPGDAVERLVPARLPPVDARPEQPLGVAQRLPECRALRAPNETRCGALRVAWPSCSWLTTCGR